MFLLILKYSVQEYEAYPNLHSTMFLLILPAREIYLTALPIYIPLCFYLYCRHSGYCCDGRKFTFHYVSTYTIIYACLRCIAVLHLHSTMFLLIRTSRRRWKARGRIYIPLCFYLYATATTEQWGVIRFTFHYVSTYTCRSVLRAWRQYHLHSTMFLLIRRVSIASSSDLSFTFHYVSTYTETLPSSDSIIVIIYIPLCFYLYQIRGVSIMAAIIYIPLCFYLYCAVLVLVHCHVIIYIPLCFYLYPYIFLF